MKTPAQTIIVLTLTFGKCLTSEGQLNVSRFQIGVGAGVFVYQGDLTPQKLGSYKTMKPSANIFVNRILNPLLSLRTNLAFGGLRGDDSKYGSPAYRKQRNFNFRSPILEMSELLVANLSRDNFSSRAFGISPYLFAGAGLTVLGIRRDFSRFNGEYFGGETTTLQGLAADANHSLPGLIPVIPVGVGIRYPLSQKIMINVETSYRFVFTDYLDGFSKAANPGKRDSYQSHTVGVIYRFVTNNSMKCPVF